MLAHNYTGFDVREPGAKKVHRTPLVSLGPHHEWSGDGHDKLAAIGFPIWALRDVWSSCWLGIWVVPNNRLKNVIAYLYLSLVYELGGVLCLLPCSHFLSKGALQVFPCKALQIVAAKQLICTALLTRYGLYFILTYHSPSHIACYQGTLRATSSN